MRLSSDPLTTLDLFVEKAMTDVRDHAISCLIRIVEVGIEKGLTAEQILPHLRHYQRRL